MSRAVTTVLVVEDDDLFREMTVRLLERAGHRVISARGRAQALAQAGDRDTAIDLLVTDLVMEEGDGLALAADLTGRHPALKVLFMSGYGREAMHAASLTSDRRTFIEKPFTPAILEGAVARLLGGSS